VIHKYELLIFTWGTIPLGGVVGQWSETSFSALKQKVNC